MKKRLLCLLLGIVMLLSVTLTACSSGDEEEVDVEEDVGAQTITMRLISEKKVCNNDTELAEYLEELKKAGKDENSQEYKDMLKTMDAYNAAEEAFSKLTKSKYKINVDLMFYTEEEYSSRMNDVMEQYALEAKNIELAERALDKYIKDYEEWWKQAYPEQEFPRDLVVEDFYARFEEYAKYKGKSSSENEDIYFEEQYKENEDGIKELVYPEADPNQLDIVYISGLDMYKQYIDNEWIIGLNSLVDTTGKKLKTYIASSLLSGVRMDGDIYAIPNNIQIGEYTYMLVDKDLYSTWYGADPLEVNDVLDIGNFLNDIVENENGYDDPGKNIIPIDASFDECLSYFVRYWNIDQVYAKDSEGNLLEAEYDEFDKDGNYVDTTIYNIPIGYRINNSNKFSLLGSLYGDPAKAGRGQIEYGFTNLFLNETYREILVGLKDYEYKGYFVKENDERDETKAAVKFENGDYSIKRAALENDGVYTDVEGKYGEAGKEYYAYVVKNPEVDEEALYGNMFAISSNSVRSQACMQILTLINTNSEARNILQYGVEGVNFTVDEDTGVLKRLNEDYMMSIEKTGNCFIAYPDPRMGEGLTIDYWNNSEKQNNDALINPLLGFSFDTELGIADYMTFDNDEDLIEYYEICLMDNSYPPRLDFTQWDRMVTASNAIWAEMSEFDNVDDLNNYIDTVLLTSDALASSQGVCRNLPGLGSTNLLISKLVSKDYDTSDTDGNGTVDKNGESPYTVYYEWMFANSYYPGIVEEVEDEEEDVEE